MVFIKTPRVNLLSAAARKAAANSKFHRRAPTGGKVALFQKKNAKCFPLPRSSMHVVYKSTHSSVFAELPETAATQLHSTFDSSAEVNFNDGAVALATKTNMELIRALGVYHVCGFPWIVQNARTMYTTATKVLGQTIPDIVVGASFFAHFCGGRSAEDLKPTVKRLGSHGVGAILDYAAEADVVEEKLSEVGANKEKELAQIIKISEAHCEVNTSIIFHAIDAAAEAHEEGGMEGFAAVKVTGMGRPELLERISTILNWLRLTFTQMDSNGDGFVGAEEFKQGLLTLNAKLTEEEQDRLFETFDVDKNGKIDLYEWLDGLSPSSPNSAPILASNEQFALSEMESQQLVPMINRLERVAGYAASKGVKLLVDAEQLGAAADAALQHASRYRLQHLPVLLGR
jgi:proline dehydrogenase